MPDVYSDIYSSGDIGTLLTVGLISMVLGYVVSSLLYLLLFKKAGVESWKAWVPVYNSWIFLELGNQKGWIILLALLTGIPFLGFIIAIVVTVYLCMAAYNIGQSLEKPSGWWVVLYFFLPLIWFLILGLDSSRWIGEVKTSRNAY